MSKPASKAFDCVHNMREIRDRLSAEIADKEYANLVRWLRSHRYADPFLRQLAERAAQQADGPDDASRRR